MKNIVHNFYRIGLWMLLSSCVAEDLPECVSGLFVSVHIKDKNYFNIDQLQPSGKVDENQPFAIFIRSLYYELKSFPAGEIVRQAVITTLDTNDSAYSFPIGGIPQGEYELTLWGNLPPGGTAGELHPGQREYADLYLAGSRFTLSGTPLALSLELERTKGKLLLFCSRFPSSIGRLEEEISSVYPYAEAPLSYSGRTAVKKEAPFSVEHTFLLAPSVDGQPSLLNLRFYPQASLQAVLTIPPTAVTIRRNELTVVRVDYHQAADYWEVWCFLDGKWTKIHHLEIY